MILVRKQINPGPSTIPVSSKSARTRAFEARYHGSNPCTGSHASSAEQWIYSTILGTVNVKYSEERLSVLVTESKTYSEVCVKLGNFPSGGNVNYIIKRIKSLKLDTSHFVGRHGSRARLGHTGRRRPWQEVLVPGGTDRRVRSDTLRRALLSLGRDHLCEACGTGPCWQNLSLTLHVDHINGHPSDNTPGNLRFLCPNCHSQTDTFGTRNRT